MENNTFDELEPVEVEKEVMETKNELKEYEKLLLAEANRKLREKAETLVGIGCFEQKQETIIDFNEYDHINYGNKYRGRYSLYQNKDTMDLVFICPLVENNKGDEDENKSMKPYAYDCIFIESMDDETYEAVCSAAKNNLSSSVKVLYRASFITFFVMLAITLFLFVYYLISASSNGFMVAFTNSLYYTSTYFAIDVIMLPILVLVSIKYKKYKDQ